MMGRGVIAQAGNNWRRRPVASRCGTVAATVPPPSRLYPTTDGWIYVPCADASAWQRLLALPAFAAVRHAAEQYPDPHSPSHVDASLAKELTTIFAHEPSAHWLDALRPHGIS